MAFNKVEYISLFLSELIGTALLIFLGCMGCVSFDGSPPNSLQVSLAFGLIVMVIISVFGCVSGAHLNPAVSLAAVVYKLIDIKVSLSRVWFSTRIQIFYSIIADGVYLLCRSNARCIHGLRTLVGRHTWEVLPRRLVCDAAACIVVITTSLCRWIHCNISFDFDLLRRLGSTECTTSRFDTIEIRLRHRCDCLCYRELIFSFSSLNSVFEFSEFILFRFAGTIHRRQFESSSFVWTSFVEQKLRLTLGKNLIVFCFFQSIFNFIHPFSSSSGLLARSNVSSFDHIFFIQSCLRSATAKATNNFRWRSQSKWRW